MNMSEFLAFADSRSAGFSSRIAPIDEDLLAELLSEARHPLPPLYLSYLQIMGGDPDELQRDRWTLDPYEVAGQVCIQGGYPRDRFTLFAVHRPSPIEPQMDWYFDHADPACRVVKFERSVSGKIEEHNVNLMYASFDELLLDWGTRVFCFAKLPFGSEAQLRRNQSKQPGTFDDGMARCRALVERLGFEELLPPTQNAWLGGRGEMVVMVDTISMPTATTFFVTLGGPDEKALLHVHEILRDNII